MVPVYADVCLRTLIECQFIMSRRIYYAVASSLALALFGCHGSQPSGPASFVGKWEDSLKISMLEIRQDHSFLMHQSPNSKSHLSSFSGTWSSAGDTLTTHPTEGFGDTYQIAPDGNTLIGHAFDLHYHRF